MKTIPYRPIMDMAITIRVLFVRDDIGIMSVLLSNDELDRLGITKEELFFQAQKNTEILFPPKMDSLLSVMTKLMDSVFLEELINEIDLEGMDNLMYVLTNDVGLNGATCILYKDKLKNIADELEVDMFYILPSSIHEVMIAKDFKSAEDFKEIVVATNQNILGRGDILSNSVYRYSRNNNVIELVA